MTRVILRNHLIILENHTHHFRRRPDDLSCRASEREKAHISFEAQVVKASKTP
jgi:hypothetical protein